MGDKIRTLWNIIMWLPHAGVQGHESGTKRDPSIGNVLTGGISPTRSKSTGQSQVLVTGPLAIPGRARGWNRSKIPPGGPTMSRRRYGCRHEFSVGPRFILETGLETSYPQYRFSIYPENRAGEGSCPVFWDHLGDTKESWWHLDIPLCVTTG